MRPRSLRLLLALLMACVLPIQGTAAATAGVCQALGHYGSHGAAPHDHHEHSGAADHPHGESAGKAPAKAHCPPCETCCATTAISSVPEIVTPETANPLVIHTPALTYSGIAPETLDRPPLAL